MCHAILEDAIKNERTIAATSSDNKKKYFDSKSLGGQVIRNQFGFYRPKHLQKYIDDYLACEKGESAQILVSFPSW